MLYVSLSIMFMHYEYRRMVCAVPGSAGFPTRQVGEEKLSTITQPTTALPCCLTTKHSHALSPKGSSSNISDMCKLLHCGNNSLLFGDEHNSTFTLKFQPNLPPGLISLANTGLQFSVCCEAKLGIQGSFPLVLAGKSCPSFTDSIHGSEKREGKGLGFVLRKAILLYPIRAALSRSGKICNTYNWNIHFLFTLHSCQNKLSARQRQKKLLTQ